MARLPAAPTSFLIGQKFWYFATAANEIGESVPCAAVQATVAVTGDQLQVTRFERPDIDHHVNFGGAVLDGTEIAALIISKRVHILKVGDVILAFNVMLFLLAMSVLGVEAALYSILTYVTAARTLDFVIYGLEQYTAITIISRNSATIRDAITGELGRGVTVYKGYGGMTGEEEDILYCVVTRLEIGKVKAIIKKRDASAFIVYNTLADIEGGVVKKTGLHH